MLQTRTCAEISNAKAFLAEHRDICLYIEALNNCYDSSGTEPR